MTLVKEKRFPQPYREQKYPSSTKIVMLKTVALRSHFVVLTFPVQLQTESQFQLGADGVLLPHLCQRHWIWRIYIFDLCSWQLYFYSWTLLDLKVFISPVSLGNKTLSIGGYSGDHFPTKSKHFPKNWCYKKAITQWPSLGKVWARIQFWEWWKHCHYNRW